MAAVSKSFYDTPNRQGLVIGVLPCEESPEESKGGGRGQVRATGHSFRRIGSGDPRVAGQRLNL